MSEKKEAKQDNLLQKTHYVSDDTINELKQSGKYKEKDLRRLFLPLDDDNNEELEVIATVPSKSVMGQYMKFMDSNPVKANDILINHCVLTSKERIKNDDGLYWTCVSELAGLLPIRQGRVKNF